MTALLVDAACFLRQNGLTALHLAGKEGHAAVVHVLLSRGADVLAATKVCPAHAHLSIYLFRTKQQRANCDN